MSECPAFFRFVDDRNQVFDIRVRPCQDVQSLFDVTGFHVQFVRGFVDVFKMSSNCADSKLRVLFLVSNPLKFIVNRGVNKPLLTAAELLSTVSTTAIFCFNLHLILLVEEKKKILL